MSSTNKAVQEKRLDYGREHPYQQIQDGQTAARKALDEVMKINDTAPADVRSDFNPNWCFGSWYLGFLLDRERAMKAGRKFTFDEGEQKIIYHFCPTPEMLKREADAVARWYEQLEAVVAANQDKAPQYTKRAINLRTLEGFYYFTCGPAWKRHPQNGGWVIDSDNPVKWHNGSIRFEDGSSIDHNENENEFRCMDRNFCMVEPIKPLLSVSMATMALRKYSTASLKKTINALLWAWGIVHETNIPSHWRKDFTETTLEIRDAMLKLLYGEEVSVHVA